MMAGVSIVLITVRSPVLTRLLIFLNEYMNIIYHEALLNISVGSSVSIVGDVLALCLYCSSHIVPCTVSIWLFLIYLHTFLV